MTTLIHNAPKMVYAHVLEFPKAKGAVTPDNWYTALKRIQKDAQGITSMWEVLAWEHSNTRGARLAAKANAAFVEKAATRPAPKPSVKDQGKPSRAYKPSLKPYMDKKCATCGGTYTTNRSHQRYCSLPCQSARGKEKWIPSPIACGVCAGEFMPIRANQKYCSGCLKEGNHKAAREKAKRLYVPSKYNHTCAVCRVGFTSNRPDAKSCSDACKKEYSKNYRDGKMKPSVAITEARCQDCDCIIPTTSVRTGQKRCRECTLVIRREKNRAYYHRMRAEKQEATND